MSAYGPAPIAPGAFLCPRCGHALRPDQAWCLDCGLAARTRVHPPPNWRLPIALTLVLLTLLAAGIAFALVALLDEREATPAPATVTVPATIPPAATPPAATTPATTVPPATTQPQTTSVPGTATTPGTTVPGAATAPGTTTPPGATPPATSTTPQRTFTIPGVGIELPANGN